jgi:hypothetical protein
VTFGDAGEGVAAARFAQSPERLERALGRVREGLHATMAG